MSIPSSPLGASSQVDLTRAVIDFVRDPSPKKLAAVGSASPKPSSPRDMFLANRFRAWVPELIALGEKVSRFSQEKLNALDGLIYGLAGHPATEDPEWGKNHRYENPQRFEAALMLVEVSEEKRSPVYQRVWELAGAPRDVELRWGEHHAANDLKRLETAIFAILNPDGREEGS